MVALSAPRRAGVAVIAAAARLIWRGLDARARVEALLGAFAVIGSAGLSAAASWAFAQSIAWMAGPGGGAMLALAVLAASLAQLCDIVTWRSHALAEQRMERVIALHLFAAALKARDGAGIGAAVRGAENAIAGCRLLFQHVLFTGPASLLSAAAAALLVLNMGHALLAALIALSAPLYVCAALWRAPAIGRQGEAVARHRVAAGGRYGDALLNRELIRLYDAAGFMSRRTDAALRRVESEARVLTRLRAGAAFLASAVFALCYAAALGAAWASAAGPDRVALIVLVNVSMLTLLGPLELTAHAVRDLVFAHGVLKDADLCGGDGDAKLGPHSNFAGSGDIEICGVCAAYDGREVLRGASVRIPAGAVAALEGESGAGKSTLAGVLCGVVRPSAGTVSIGGALQAPSGDGLSGKIAMATQSTMLIDGSIADNIALGRDHSAEELARALWIAGLEPLLAALPLGLSTLVGEAGHKLSGGERQRIAVARAMLKPACIYLLDEATSALDAEAEAEVMRRLIGCRQGATVLIIAHRSSALRQAELRLRLEGGRIVDCSAAPAARTRRRNIEKKLLTSARNID